MKRTLSQDNLKDEVEKKFGKTLKYSKDCRLLSEQILEATSRQLSDSTIKRFFGIIPSQFYPSKYTLDTLSVFVGFDNWNAYDNAQDIGKIKPEVNNFWEVLSENVRTITETSIQTLSQKAKYNFRKFVKREFAEEYLEEFFLSDRTATILVAPKGYGKSSILLQWHYAHFTGSDKRFENDVVCLIDGGIFFGFLNQSNNNKVLDLLLDFDVKLSQELLAGIDVPDKKKRCVLIIDDIDSIFSIKEKNYRLVENLMQLILLTNNHSGFKVILTCRPENIDMFASQALQNPQLYESFYKVNFFYTNHFETINIPLLNKDEIQKVLENYECNLSFFYLSLFYPDIFKVLNIPFFLSFFISEGDYQAPEFSEIGFLNQLIRYFIYSHPFAEEKQILIKRFLQLCSLEEDVTSVGKELLLEEIDCQLAYKELIKSGIIHEYLDSSELPHVHLKVQFSNKEVFEYLLVRSFIKNKNLEIDLINTLFIKYKYNFSIQYGLLKWLIKIAFHDRNDDLLKQVHLFLDRKVNVLREITGESMPGSLRSVQIAFIECFRTHKSSCEVLMPWFAKSNLGRKLYFEEYFDMDNLMFFLEESLEVYVRNNNTVGGEMTARFIRFMKGFYSLDYDVCSLEFEFIKKIDHTRLSAAYLLGYYFSSYFLYSSLNNNYGSRRMLENVILTSGKFGMKNPQPLRFNPSFDFFMVYNLNTCDSFEEIKIIAEYSDRAYDFSQMKISPFYHFYKLCHARSLLHTGEINRAMELFQQIDIHEFPYHMRHFMKINVNLALVDFMEYQKKTSEALELLSEANSLAQLMGYNFFLQKIALLEVKLHGAGKDIPNE